MSVPCEDEIPRLSGICVFKPIVVVVVNYCITSLFGTNGHLSDIVL